MSLTDGSVWFGLVVFVGIQVWTYELILSVCVCAYVHKHVCVCVCVCVGFIWASMVISGVERVVDLSPTALYSDQLIRELMA